MELPTGFLPLFFRSIILTIRVAFTLCKAAKTEYKFMSTIRRKTHKFVYVKETGRALEKCCICLSRFAEGEKGAEIVECKHAFHTSCLEQWLRRCATVGTCPLCRSLVVPAAMAAEYHMVQSERENDGVEKELALLLHNAFNGGIF